MTRALRRLAGEAPGGTTSRSGPKTTSRRLTSNDRRRKPPLGCASAVGSCWPMNAKIDRLADRRSLSLRLVPPRTTAAPRPDHLGACGGGARRALRVHAGWASGPPLPRHTAPRKGRAMGTDQDVAHGLPGRILAERRLGETTNPGAAVAPISVTYTGLSPTASGSQGPFRLHPLAPCPLQCTYCKSARLRSILLRGVRLRSEKHLEHGEVCSHC